MKKNAVYQPIEDLHYAFSVILDEDLDSLVFMHRLNMLADLIDEIVLAESMVCDAPGEATEEYDKRLFDLLQHLGLGSIITPARLGEQSLEEHVNTVQYLFPKVEGVVISELDPDVALAEKLQSTGFFDFDRDELKQILSHNYNLAVSSAVGEDMLHVLDYVRKAFNSEEMLLDPIVFNWKADPMSLDDIFEAVKQNTCPPESKQLIEGLVAFYWQICVDTALYTAFKEGLVLKPVELHSRLILSRPIFSSSSKIFVDKLSSKKYQNMARLNDFLYAKYTKFIELPILFNYILSKANSFNELFDIALDLRQQKITRRFRRWCMDIDEALASGDQETAVRMIDETEDYIRDITNKTKSQLKTQVQVSFPPAVTLELPSVDIKRNYYLAFLKHLYKRSPLPVTQKDKIRQIFGVSLD